MSSRNALADPVVLITEAVNAGLEPLGSLTVNVQPGIWADRPRLLAAAAGCAGLVVRNQTRVDRELVAAAPHLKVVGRLGAGLDNLDLESLRERDIEVVHGGGINARAVAEYVVAAALNLSRGIARSDREVRSGTWHRHVGRELGGRVLGVVGLGATGKATALLGTALGMTVLGYDPYLAAPEGVTATALAEVCRRADVLTIHVPLLESTRGLIGETELNSLPEGAIVINASRGGIVDEAALLKALDSERLGGAALDVRTSEPPAADDPFRERQNVLLTAHLAGLTVESQAAIAAHVLAGVSRVLSAVEG